MSDVATPHMTSNTMWPDFSSTSFIVWCRAIGQHADGPNMTLRNEMSHFMTITAHFYSFVIMFVLEIFKANGFLCSFFLPMTLSIELNTSKLSFLLFIIHPPLLSSMALSQISQINNDNIYWTLATQIIILRSLYYFSVAFFCLSQLLCYYVKLGFPLVKIPMGCTGKCSKSSQTFLSHPNGQSHQGLQYLKK